MTVRAILEGGKFRPVEPVDLREGTEVHLTVEVDAGPAPVRRGFLPLPPDFGKPLTEAQLAARQKWIDEHEAWLATLPPGPKDDPPVSENVDRYLYGDLSEEWARTLGPIKK